MWLQTLGDVNEMVFYIFAAITALNLVMAIANNVLRCFYKGGVAGSSMDFYISYGCLALLASILMRGLHKNIISTADADAICKVFPAVLTIGLLWLIGGVMLKGSAIALVHSKRKESQALRYEWIPNLIMVGLIILFGFIVLAWIIGKTPMIFPLGNGVYICGGTVSPEFQIVISAAHALMLTAALVVGALVVYRTKGTHTYVESLLLLVTVVTIFVVSFVGALMVFTGKLTGTASSLYALTAGLMEAGIFVTLLCQLIGKVVLARKERNGDDIDEVYDEMDVDDKDSRL